MNEKAESETTSSKMNHPSLIDVIARYRVAWEIDPPKGERPALTVGLTKEQHAATIRAKVPPGDKDGSAILADLCRITKAFRLTAPNGVCSVFVYSNSTQNNPQEP